MTVTDLTAADFEQTVSGDGIGWKYASAGSQSAYVRLSNQTYFSSQTNPVRAISASSRAGGA